MTKVQDEVWRKATFSGQDSDCVEVSNRHRLRDSKNPDGPVLAFADRSPLTALIESIH